MKLRGCNRCYNDGKQHRFEARYDEVSLQQELEFATKGLGAEEVRRLLYGNIYVRDVCVWCGRIIAKESSA